MKDPRSVAALGVAERYATGEATEDELDAARAAAAAAADDAAWAAALSAARAADDVAWNAAEVAADAAAEAADAARAAERKEQLGILSEFGNPFERGEITND